MRKQKLLLFLFFFSSFFCVEAMGVRETEIDSAKRSSLETLDPPVLAKILCFLVDPFDIYEPYPVPKPKKDIDCKNLYIGSKGGNTQYLRDKYGEHSYEILFNYLADLATVCKCFNKAVMYYQNAYLPGSDIKEKQTWTSICFGYEHKSPNPILYFVFKLVDGEGGRNLHEKSIKHLTQAIGLFRQIHDKQLILHRDLSSFIKSNLTKDNQKEIIKTAAKRGWRDIVDHCVANCRFENNERKVIHQYAIMGNRLPIIKLLLEKLPFKDRSGKSFEQIALWPCICSFSNEENTKYFLEFWKDDIDNSDLRSLLYSSPKNPRFFKYLKGKYPERHKECVQEMKNQFWEHLQTGLLHCIFFCAPQIRDYAADRLKKAYENLEWLIDDYFSE